MNSTDQKVPDKKPLVMRPKEDPNDEVTKETLPKKCLVLKPQNDDSSISGEQEKEILPTKKCLVLKPKDDEESFQTETETVKKCLVRIPKDECEANTSKVSNTIEGKDLEKKIRRRENGISDSNSIKSKVRLDHNIYNGLVFKCFIINYNIMIINIIMV